MAAYSRPGTLKYCCYMPRLRTTEWINEGGGIYASFPSTLQNTLVAANFADEVNDDVSGDFLSRGGNLIGDVGSASGFTDGVQGDQVGQTGAVIDPRLGPLQDNGGPTITHLPLRGSRAVDRVVQTCAVHGPTRGEPAAGR